MNAALQLLVLFKTIEMKNLFAGITGFCVAMSSVVMVVVVCFLGYRYVFDGSNSSNRQESATQDVTMADAKNQSSANNAKPNSNFFVAVDNDDIREAKRMEKKRVARLLEEADRVLGKLPGGENYAGPTKIHSFDKISNEEKNRIWWEIASVASLSGGESITYTLTINQAMGVGKTYGTSTMEVFRLFREGATADWRTDMNPAEETSDDDS